MSNISTSYEGTYLELCELIVHSASKGALRKAVFSKSEDRSIIKAAASPISVGGSACLQIEFFHTDNKATHKNIVLGENAASDILQVALGFGQINLLTALGDCELRTSKSGKCTLIGSDKLKRKLDLSAQIVPASVHNNREKRYILDGSEPFLTYLGVSDKNGRIYDKKQSKFRQINRFLELVRDVEDKLPKDELRICDLCCGKSYLSFAVYHYFANIKGYKVSMTGIDLKSDVIEHCSRTARDLGFDGLEFVSGDIRAYKTDIPPSLVISLHACDIATDIVLEKAAEWQADVILSTPCCHHEMNKVISSPSLSFITDYSMLRQKLCDAATDALRLKRLEAHGYSTAALELIDPDETPKNVMLRAVRKRGFKPDSPEARRAMEEYLAAKRFLCGDTLEGLHF